MEMKVIEKQWKSALHGGKTLFFNMTDNKVVVKRGVAEVKEYLGNGIFVVRPKFSGKCVLFSAEYDVFSSKFENFDLYDKDSDICIVHDGVSGRKDCGKYKVIDTYKNTFNDLKFRECNVTDIDDENQNGKPVSLVCTGVSKIENSNAYAFCCTDKKTKNVWYRIFNPQANFLTQPYAHVDKSALFGYVRVKKELGWAKQTWLLNLDNNSIILSDYEKNNYKEMMQTGDHFGVDEYADKIVELTPENLFYSVPETITKHDVVEFLKKPENKKLAERCENAVKNKMADTFVDSYVRNEICKSIDKLNIDDATHLKAKKDVVVFVRQTKSKVVGDDAGEKAKE